jgi:VIT1/CCC1 family predicted Fe2+/Mn2+ transporter
MDRRQVDDIEAECRHVPQMFRRFAAYFFTPTAQEGLVYSSIITFFCLIVFGLVKSKLTGQPLFKGALRVTVVGAAAASIAYTLAKLIT